MRQYRIDKIVATAGVILTAGAIVVACGPDNGSTATSTPQATPTRVQTESAKRQCAKDTNLDPKVTPYPCENKEVNSSNGATECGMTAATSLKQWYETTLNGIPGKARAREANPDVCAGVVWTGWQSLPKDPNNPSDPGYTRDFRIVTVVTPTDGRPERVSVEQPARPEDPTVELYTVGMQAFPGDQITMCVLRQGQPFADLNRGMDCMQSIRIVP